MPAPNQPTTAQINPTGETRLVLNTDTVICRGCYEPDVLEVARPGADRRERPAAMRDLRRRRGDPWGGPAVRLPTFASTLLVLALPFATASLPDTLTVSTSACIALGGIAGLMRPDIGARRVLENIALGAGTGGVIGALIGFVIYAVGRLAGGA